MERMPWFCILKSAIIVLIIFVAFYSSVFYLASNGDAYGSFVVWANNSQAFRNKFGDIKDINLKFFGSYSEKTRGDMGYANFTASVDGSEFCGDVKVSMEQTGGIWKVRSVKINGYSIAKEE